MFKGPPCGWLEQWCGFFSDMRATPLWACSFLSSESLLSLSPFPLQCTLAHAHVHIRLGVICITALLGSGHIHHLYLLFFFSQPNIQAKCIDAECNYGWSDTEECQEKVARSRRKEKARNRGPEVEDVDRGEIRGLGDPSEISKFFHSPVGGHGRS